MRSKFAGLPLSHKISGIFVLANLLTFIVDIALLFAINRLSVDMEDTYRENSHLNEMLEALEDVQRSMTDYLNSKSTDSLSGYYMAEQYYAELAGELDTIVSDRAYDRMSRNIHYMSEDYLQEVAQTIEAKRGRNVERYRVLFEQATKKYEYTKTYIRSLNEEQFISNSVRYTTLARNFRKFEVFAVAVMFVVLFGSAVIITNIITSLIRPLGDLAKSADEVANGRLDAELPESTYNDEIGKLTVAFGKMMVSIRDYIEKLRMSMEKERAMQEKELMMETHLKDAQLKYRRAQINPHFLFNTLNAGAQLAMMEGADRTYEYVQTVADFFRYNVRKQDELVTIENEVNLVDNYIRILNVRFSGDIHYTQQVDQRLLKVKMPGMILQPIVENAVNHGIREMGDQGHIFLKVYRDEGRVFISVKDNGKGMSKENIDKLLGGKWKYEENTGDSNGVGMDNVIARLKLFSDTDDVIRIQSEGIDMGTEVVICLPFESDRE